MARAMDVLHMFISPEIIGKMSGHIYWALSVCDFQDADMVRQVMEAFPTLNSTWKFYF